MGKQSISLCVSAAIALGACQTIDANDNLVFAKKGIDVPVYSNDVTGCEKTAAEKGPSDDEKTSGVVFGLLLGGFVGAAAAGSSHDAAKYRMYIECMYGKGYQQIPLPIDQYKQATDEAGKFNERQAVTKLIEEKKIDALLASGEK